MSKKRKQTKRIIDKKNYIILTVIFIASLLSIFVLKRVYENYKAYELKTPILTSVVSEVKYEELEDHIRENSDVLIFFGVSDDDNSRNIEKKLLKIVKKDSLSLDILYLNLSQDETREEILNKFNKDFVEKDNKKIENYPAFVLIIEGKVASFASRDETELTYDEITQIIDQYELEK